MGFKLGKNRGNYAVGGVIKTKMRFGKQAGVEGSVPGTPVIRVPLEEGVMGEANMDGSIYVNELIEPGSFGTGICNVEHTRKSWWSLWDRQPEHIQNDYGKQYIEQRK